MKAGSAKTTPSRRKHCPVSDELRIGTKDRAIVLVLRPAYGGSAVPTKTQVIGIQPTPFSDEAKQAIATLYGWLEHAKKA